MNSLRRHPVGRFWAQRCLPLPHAGINPVRRTTPPLLAFHLKQQVLRLSTEHQRLDLPALDRKWRQRWAESGSKAHEATSNKDAQYILTMFPYPSGQLHLGHFRVFTITDVLARYKRLQGQDVLLPMGWDAFGLPAENAAIERGVEPAVWTKQNIAKMKDQLELMNGSWSWDTEIDTSSPEFYKHTQKLFLMLYERGLAYQDTAEVNYDPVDKTVVANEQVDANGCSWRSGARVEKRELKQWFFRISAFRDALLDDLEVLSRGNAWPDTVLAQQKNWLGKSTGAAIKFPVLALGHDMRSAIEVYTTRPETLFGVQYLALAATHPVVATLAKSDPELQAFLDTLPGLPAGSKVGYLLPHLRAVNPLAYHEDSPDAAKESIPVYVAPYVLGDYGEGAVMGVPGHDVRDHAFWKHNRYDEPVRIVLAASEDESTTAMKNEPFVAQGVMTEHAGPFRGKHSAEAAKILVTMLEAAGLAKSIEKWRLRDWLISRQRYWGTPIPIVHCDSCGPVPVPDDQLPVRLPAVDNHWARGKPGNPLESPEAEEWVKTSCPKCGGDARRDTDTMDTFVDSSWYYMRYPDSRNTELPFSVESARNFLPVDVYIGGIEHAILHLLYARFVYKFLATTPLCPDDMASRHVHGTPEPFARLITQGMVHGKTYSDGATGRFLKPDEVDLTDPKTPKIKKTGEKAVVSFEKMSKSKYNGVDPSEFAARYGADAARAHMLFQAPVSDVLQWDEAKISGVIRWLGRLHEYVLSLGPAPVASGGSEKALDSAALVQADLQARFTHLETMNKENLQQWDADAAIWGEVQKTIESVAKSYNQVYSLNTAVSDLMGLTNTVLEQAGAGAGALVQRAAAEAIVKMVAPITPAFAEECWSILRPHEESVFQSASFPVTDGTAAILQSRTQQCAVQINGKLRAVVEIPQAPQDMSGDALRDWVVEEILKTEQGKGKLVGQYDVRRSKRVILVKGGATVNFVL